MNPVDHTTLNPRLADAFGRFFYVLGRLRRECPWDKKQTWESLRPLTIEEAFELAQALEDVEVQLQHRLAVPACHLGLDTGYDARQQRRQHQGQRILETVEGETPASAATSFIVTAIISTHFLRYSVLEKKSF